MKIRQADYKDLNLNQLDSKCFPGLEPYPKAGAFWWIARSLRGPCAFAGLKLCGISTGFLCRVGVEKDYRGKGLHKRLIRVREAKARKLGWKWLITYCSPGNMASANNLLACGYKLYSPQTPYGVPGALYFRKAL